MSWQHIDENTYIDDTLVTCAEYQLFIDEMREQGKFYQPDHWTSYQFLEGRAQAPIVGVRFGDANAFCEWLSMRTTGEWSYHLPTSVQAEQASQNDMDQSTLGYWIIGTNGEDEFGWMGSIPVNPRNIGTNIALEPEQSVNNKRADDIYWDIHFAIEKEFYNASDKEDTHRHALALPHALDRPLDLAIVLEHTYDIGGAYGNPADDELALELENVTEHALNRSLNTNRALDLAHALHWAFQISFIATGYTSILDRIRYSNYIRTLENNKHHAYLRALYLYLDIITLQERIAGRSPAFEGIRLVKERIR